MTFTYTPSDTPTDLTRVRFYVEDTKSPGLLSDEEISMAIAESNGEWKRALVPCVNLIMSKLSKESGVRMDWLQVDRAEALKHYRSLKSELAAQFAAGTGYKIGSGVVHTSRKDVP